MFQFLKIMLISFLVVDMSGESVPRVLAATYTTSSTRTANVVKYCSNGINRQTAVSASAISQAASYNAQIESLTTISGSTLISNLLSGNMNAVITPFTSSPPILFFIFIGIFMVGFVVFQFIWPFLCCCCCCPSCCPSQCCQKDENEHYTKCELYWPVFILMLAVLLAVGTSAYGFTQASEFQNNLPAFSCSVSILIDDIINGNVTSNGSSFFTGLNQLIIQMNNIQSNMNTINGSLNNLSSASGTNMSNILTHVTNTLNSIDLISSGTSNTALTLTYQTPLTSAAASTPIPSSFPDVLGTKTAGGAVKGMYTAITAVQSALTTIASNAQAFQTSSSSFSTGITTATNSINDFSGILSGGDNTFGTYLSYADSSSQYSSLGMQGFFGAIIGLNCFLLLGAFIMCCCSKPNCRYLMYFMCVILFIITILSFIIATVFSIVVPVLYFGCNYLSVGLGSAAGFNANFGQFINNATIQGYITTCLASGSGNLLSAIGGSTLGSINSLGSAFTGIGSFIVSTYTANITTYLTTLESTIVSYGLAQVLDINDTASITILTNLANPAQYSGCQAASTIFAADSWVPSNSQNPVSITCTATTGAATNTQCSSTAIFNAATNGCAGCMDTMKIFFGNTSTGTVSTALGGRYPSAACASFISDLSNVWGNFYQRKKTVIGVDTTGASTGSGVMSRFNTAKAQINTLSGYLNTNITNLFAATNSAVNATLSAITDPVFGLVAGLNCKLFGEDIVRVNQSICVNIFNTTYLLRLILGIIAFALMFVHCCTVCSAVRFYKQQQRKNKTQDGFPAFEESMSRLKK